MKKGGSLVVLALVAICFIEGDFILPRLNDFAQQVYFVRGRFTCSIFYNLGSLIAVTTVAT